MKKTLLLLLIVPFLFTNCSDDDDGGNTIEFTTYTLAEVDGSMISGTATFTKINDTTTEITVALSNTPAGGDHPMHIHMNDAATGGGIAITLTNIDGDTGLSTTTVTQLDDETAITYEGLIAYDGYINVHLSPTELATIVAQGNIGSNVN
ncbi:hypothetical protein [Aquimarina sp. SS2-1]|uniref:hypothetical protein n=1 Tax=Aquimarina besae TaxID=3342247 RepID=UPI0036714D1E